MSKPGRFVTLLAAVYLAVTLVYFLVVWLCPFLFSKNLAECIAWLLITCSFCGFLPAAAFFGRGRTYEHSYGEIYATVGLSIVGDVLGLALMGYVLGHRIILLLLSLALIAYHFVTRHATTEDRHTPHFGQTGRGTLSDDLRKELALGHTGDLFQVLLLLGLYSVTQHPLWLFGALLFSFNYVLAVRVHLDFHDEPLTYALALMALGIMAVLVWPLFGWFGEVRRYEYFFAAVVFGGGLAPIPLLFVERKGWALKQIPRTGLVIAVVLLMLGVFGLLAMPESLDVSMSTFLLGSPNAKKILSFAILIVFLSTFWNALIAGAWRYIKRAFVDSHSTLGSDESS